MAFDLIQFLIASGIGAGVGLVSGLIAVAIGKRRLNKRLGGIVESESFISRLGKAVLGQFGEEIFSKKIKCEFCHKAIPNGAIFCPYCSKLAKGKVNCPNCNQSLPDDGDYWHNIFTADIQRD